MGQAAPSTIEQRIIDAIRANRGGCAAAGSIAARLKIARTVVERALDDMLDLGTIECIDAGAGNCDLFRNIVAGKPVGVLPPRLRGACGDGDDDSDDTSLSFEQVQAERLWKARMGDSRWHDDPRATAELRSGKQFLPFSER